ncbi:protein shifted [Chrysoperla carnea]|uniref:protein shifted n=1 Tax=Chrysoperla carnea TaxID=189513 RepID=UPI001D061F47|nr:protein shifted [Chrysoperla carnea]
MVMLRTLLLLTVTVYISHSSLRGDPNSNKNDGGDLALWIDEQQVKMFSGLSMQIYAIVNGTVLPYVLDPNLNKYLPIIPAEVGYVNFTWKAGLNNYRYSFDNLQSFDEAILKPPVISIKTKGRIPKKPKEFSVLLPCSGNISGLAAFSISLEIKRKGGKVLDGTPLKLKLRKECAQRGPDPECDKKCLNRGWCNHDKICQCQEGYMGQYCSMALCYPRCMNGGNCTSPGVCSCPPGFQGRHCEGGICTEKCKNGGKCVQKDTCLCSKGYLGAQCEVSRCVIPCLNGGRCRGTNKCKCNAGFRGDHCEIGRVVSQRSMCSRPCRHGTCRPDNTCLCDPGWTGRHCQIRKRQMDPQEFLDSET